MQGITSKGYYEIDSLETTFYSVLSELGSQRSFTDSVYINNNGNPRKIYNADLLPTGSISGYIKFEDTEEERSDIYILMMGTNRYEPLDSIDGKFTFSDLAEGDYQMRIITAKDNYKSISSIHDRDSGTVDLLNYCRASPACDAGGDNVHGLFAILRSLSTRKLSK